jgi:hypothetical protein
MFPGRRVLGMEFCPEMTTLKSNADDTAATNPFVFILY